MRPAAAVLLFLAAAPARGDDGLLPNPPPRPPVAYPPDALFDKHPAPPAAEDPPSGWRGDVIAGLPCAVRLQRQIGDSPTWLEMGGGLYVILPTAFVGLRADLPLHRGRRTDILIRPGVDVYLAPDFGIFSSGTMLTALVGDIDFVWCHHGERFDGQVGFKIGAGPVWAGNGRSSAVPVLGVLFGFSY